jgi:hypothetical protein
MSASFSKKPENSSTCENCGKDFFCGAVTGKCWCFEIDLSEQALAELKDSFKKCLCENCLRAIETK